MPVSSKFHVASRIWLHSSWNMCNQANTLLWPISVLGKVCVARRTHDLCTQLQESTRPILRILLSVSLSVSNFWEKGLLADWPKIQWRRTQHSQWWLDVIEELVLPCSTSRQAIIEAAIIYPFFYHFLLSVCAIRWHFRMPKDSRDAKDEDKLLGRRTASFHFSDQPMPLVWSSIVDTLTRVFWTATSTDLIYTCNPCTDCIWLYCRFLLHILW